MKFIMLSLAICLSLFTASGFAKAKSTSSSKINSSSLQAVNLNTAGVKELNHAYKKISMRRAKAIVAYRRKHGPFKTLTELVKVKSIGRSFIKRNLVGLKKVFTIS